MFFVKNIVLLS